MPLILYHGDGRAPREICDAGSFRARLPLDVAAVRAVLVRAAIDPGHDVAGLTGRRTSQIVDSLQHHRGLVGLGPLYEAIKKEREAGSIQIATETTPAGGGMSGGYVYHIEWPTPLYEWAPRRGGTMNGIAPPPRTLNANADLTAASVRTFLLTDANVDDDPRASIGAATAFALHSPARTVKEVALLTAVPRHWLTTYRQGNGEWTALP